MDEEKGGICLNIDGSFTCTCKEGYTGDGNDYQKYTRLTQSGLGSKLNSPFSPKDADANVRNLRNVSLFLL